MFNSTSCVIFSTISVGKSTGISAISTMYLRMIQLASSLRSSRLPSKCLKCSTSNQNTTHSTESSATQKFNNYKRQQILIRIIQASKELVIGKRRIAQCGIMDSGFENYLSSGSDGCHRQQIG